MGNSIVRKIEIPKADIDATKADIETCDKAFDLIYVHHEELSDTLKVAWLLRKIDTLEAELSTLKDKAYPSPTIEW